MSSLPMYGLGCYMLCDYMWRRHESPIQRSKRVMTIWYVLPCACLLVATVRLMHYYCVGISILNDVESD